MDPDKIPAIAIDLGTTSSCVGAFVNGRVEIFTNDEGYTKTPSYVAFTEVERLIGEPAKEREVENPKNTIFDTKRLIGRRLTDPLVQKDIERWPFRVEDFVGNPMIKVEFHGEEMMFTPEEISSMVLSKLKIAAETYFGGLVHDAVITVPTHFSDSQRQATKDAGTIAGLRVVKILNDTTAAALAYGLGQNLTGQRNVVIVDLGGGSFDVSVLSISEGPIFEVKATAGNTRLGGRDFDYRLLDYLMNECKRKYKVDVRMSPKAVKRMLIAAEGAKKTLTCSPEASVEIEALFKNTDFYTKISRARFEALCNDLFESILGPVQLALNDAKLERHQIHDVVLVGGSTRMPKIQTLLQDFFGGKELIKSINPDEAVTRGAVLHSATLSADKSKLVKDVLVIETTVFSIGTEAEGGAMNVIIRRGTVMPARVTGTFTTSEDNQTAVIIEVFEGDRALAKDNNLLGRFELSGIAPNPKGVPQINVNFYVNDNGILQVTAQDKNSGNENITVVTHKGRPTSDEIHRMILEIDVFKMVEQKQRERLLVLNKLETYIFEVKRVIEIHDDYVTVEDRTRAKKACEKVLIWLEAHRNATKEEIQQKLTNLKTICTPVLSQVIGCSSSKP